jgi:serine/threonine-protein kinase
MDAARWREVRTLLEAALELDPSERPAFVAAIGDPQLRGDVQRLLEREAEASPLFARSPLAVAGEALAASRPEDHDRDQIGRRIGPYRLDSLLGSGGMGSVYRAHRVDGRFEQTVAIKLVLSAHPGLRDRFRNEQGILAGLKHPAIAQLLDGGETEDGTPFIAMEFVEGVSITDYCRAHLPDAEARVRLMIEVADALAHAHRNLVVHRDIKPSNILVTAEGHPMLLDFGIAKLVGAERGEALTVHTIGPMTPAYAAPEQFEGLPIGVHTDVYQFGVLLYRLLSGRLPFDVGTGDALAWGRAVLDTEPRTLGRSLSEARRSGEAGDAARIPGREAERDLEAIVRRAMEREPVRRYGSIDLLVADLEAYIGGRPVGARRGGTWYGVRRFVRRHRVAVATAALASVGLLATTGIALRQAHLARIEAERSRLAVEYIQEVFRAADPNTGRGGQRSAEDLLDLATERIGPKMEAYPDLRGPLQVLIATAYSNLGAMNRAVPAFDAAIVDLRNQGAPALELGVALQRGSWAAQRNGDRAQALAWVDEAERLVRDSGPEALQVRDGLAETRWLIAREVDAFEESLAIAEAALAALDAAPPDIRDALRSRVLRRMGTSLTDLGRFPEAEIALNEAVALSERAYGADDYWTLRARQTLGWHYGSRGEPARALAVLEPVGERLLALFGPLSLEYAGNLYNRANAYAMQGEHERALQTYRESLTATESAVDPGSSQIGSLWWNIAVQLTALGRHEEARDALLEVERKWVGTLEAESLMRSRLHLATARNALDRGDREGSERLVGMALAARWGGEDHADHAEAWALDAELAALRGDRAGAAASWREAAGLLRATGDPRWVEKATRWEAQATEIESRR